MIAKVSHGTINGGTIVVVECPVFEVVRAPRREGGDPHVALCEAEIEVEQPYGGGVPTFLLPECPVCHTVFAENDTVREAIIAAALKAIDNYDGPPDDPDAWSGGFAANH